MCNEKIEIYKIYREQVNQENDLYYKRLGWFATAQSILLGSVGLLLQAAFNPEYDEYSDKIIWFLYFVSLSGLFSCAVANTKLTEARFVLTWIREQWDDKQSEFKDFPHVSGGGEARKKPHLEAKSGHLPFVFALVWIFGFALLMPDLKKFITALIVLLFLYFISWISTKNSQPVPASENTP